MYPFHVSFHLVKYSITHHTLDMAYSNFISCLYNNHSKNKHYWSSFFKYYLVFWSFHVSFHLVKCWDSKAKRPICTATCPRCQHRDGKAVWIKTGITPSKKKDTPSTTPSISDDIMMGNISEVLSTHEKPHVHQVNKW